jgi:hypothetical protein
VLTEVDVRPPETFDGRYSLSPSAARVVYEYYMCAHPQLHRYERLLAETDRLDSGHIDLDDVLDPREYILLGFTLDPRSGLGAFREYFLQLLDALKTRPIAEVLELPEVRERVDRMHAADAEFRAVTHERSKLDGNVVFTDLRGVTPLPVGNRFLIYTLYPAANVSLRVHPGPSGEQVAVAVGHSIFNRTCRTALGELMARYGGGGHRGAGTCLLPAQDAEALIAEIVGTLKLNG